MSKEQSISLPILKIIKLWIIDGVHIMKNIFSTVLILAISWITLVASANASQIWSNYGQLQYISGFQGIAYAAADVLQDNINYPLDRTKPILFTSFVDIDHLQSSSTFGRLLGEQVASRLAQHGYKMIELKLRSKSLKIKKGVGEVALTRELKKIRDNYNAQAILIGTYAIVDGTAIITVRLLGAKDGTMLATYDFTLELGSKLHKLVERGTKIEKAKASNPHIPEGPLGKGSILLDPQKPISAKIIQTRLAKLNYYHARIDGIWGPKSKGALQRFKTKHDLASPSKWDVNTQIELFEGTGQ